MIEREQGIEALAADTFDVLVIGGGITGAGVALDAATRGYTVALIERHDFASGTSSRSSKLVHGGLRYLQQFDLGLVREALLERQLMLSRPLYGGRHHLKAVLGNPHTQASHLHTLAAVVADSLNDLPHA